MKWTDDDLPATLTIALINVRSLRNKVILLCESLLNKNINICCLTETRLTEADTVVYTELSHYGFKLLHCPRKTGRGGGVGIIVKANLNIQPIKSLSYRFFELLQATLRIHTKNIQLSVVYRTGQLTSADRSNFMKEYESFLSSLEGTNADNFICGDFNIHVHDKNDAFAKDFIDLNESVGLYQTVEASTHNSGGILDLIFTRDDFTPTKTTVFNQVDLPLSDHFMVVASYLIPTPSRIKNVNISYRNTSQINTDEFCADLYGMLQSTNEASYFNLNDEVANLFNVIKTTLDRHAPLITKTKKLSSKVFTNESIKSARRACRKTERKFKKSGLQVDRAAFQIAHTKLIETVNSSQRMFFNHKLKMAKHNTKAVYQIINHLLHKDQPSILPEEKNDVDLANEFAEPYVEKISRIVTIMEVNLPTRQTCPESNVTANAGLSEFQPINEEYLLSLYQRTNDKFSSVDNIPSQMMKYIKQGCMGKILQVINASMNSGIFPDLLKTSHATPIIKNLKGDRNSLANYRLVNSLSFLSKLEEKCVLDQLQDHLEQNQLYFNLQSAFKRNHSCETALLKIYDDLLKMIGPGQCILMMFLDFSAAFDTVSHDILLWKLEHKFHISGNVLKWFNSYLTNRKFKVKIGDKFSKCTKIDYGVPQGSVLGPVLFSLYTQELHEITEAHGISIHMFADDIQLYLQCDRNDLKIDQMKDCLADIVKWASRNCLKLNDQKSQFMVVSKSNILDDAVYDNFNYNMEKVIKNLGFFIDSNLNFSAQINQVCRKGFNLLRNLWRSSAKVNDEQLKIRIVNACILTHIDYCNSLYLKLPEKQTKKLQRLMNASIRFIYNLRRSEEYSITEHMKKCHFLPVTFRVDFKVCVLVYKCLNDSAPSYLMNLVTLKTSLESLRVYKDKSLLEVIKPHQQNYKNRGFSIEAPNIWNLLPPEIRNANSLDIFKTKLKTHYFSMAFKK